MSYDVNLKCKCCHSYVFESNHTSNTAGMWNKHNFYFEDWHNKPAQMMEDPLYCLLSIMGPNGAKVYRGYCPTNWGTFESTFKWLSLIHEACLSHRTCIVEVSN